MCAHGRGPRAGVPLPTRLRLPIRTHPQEPAVGRCHVPQNYPHSCPLHLGGGPKDKEYPPPPRVSFLLGDLTCRGRLWGLTEVLAKGPVKRKKGVCLTYVIKDRSPEATVRGITKRYVSPSQVGVATSAPVQKREEGKVVFSSVFTRDELNLDLSALTALRALMVTCVPPLPAKICRPHGLNWTDGSGYGFPPKSS